MQGSGQSDVSAVLSVAVQETVVFEPWQSGADSELAHGKLPPI
jgi:hypothetical protein